MTSIKYFIFLLTVSASAVFAEEPLIQACEVQDIDCLRNSTKKFLTLTAAGIPQYDFKPIDPIHVDEINQDLGAEYGIMHHLKDLTVTGLKDQVIADFKMDTTAKTVVLKVTATMNIDGKLTVHYTKPVDQAFSGTYTSTGPVAIETTYPYDVTVADDGVEHFVVGKETIKCEALQVPTYVVNKELMEALDSHKELSEVRAKFHTDAAKIMKESMCDLIQKVYPTVLHNLRASARIMPKSAYFTNL